MFSDILFSSLSFFIALISVFVVILTTIFVIKSNKELNQQVLFANVTKEERELNMKFQEYAEKIDKIVDGFEKDKLIFNYETLLFNYYEYLAICLRGKLIREIESRLYFRDLVVGVKNRFDDALIFEKAQAKKEEYRGIQWLFKRWKI